jgi:ADP-ribose pyrophosphatase
MVKKPVIEKMQNFRLQNKTITFVRTVPDNPLSHLKNVYKYVNHIQVTTSHNFHTLHSTHFTPHTSLHTPHSTHLIPHTSFHTPHSTHLTPHTFPKFPILNFNLNLNLNLNPFSSHQYHLTMKTIPPPASNKNPNTWIGAGNFVESRISTETVFDGVLLNVNRDKARMPDGSESVREWIRHPGACTVLPVFDNGDIMLVRQFRYPMGQIFLEVPAGKIDAGEAEEVTAARELEEETGLRCSRLEYLGHNYPCIGYSDEVIHFYMAWGIEQLKTNTDSDEFLEPLRLPFREAVEMVYRGEITDSKTIIHLLRGLKWWEENGAFSLG